MKTFVKAAVAVVLFCIATVIGHITGAAIFVNLSSQQTARFLGILCFVLVIIVAWLVNVIVDMKQEARVAESLAEAKAHAARMRRVEKGGLL